MIHRVVLPAPLGPRGRSPPRDARRRCRAPRDRPTPGKSRVPRAVVHSSPCPHINRCEHQVTDGSVALSPRSDRPSARLGTGLTDPNITRRQLLGTRASGPGRPGGAGRCNGDSDSASTPRRPLTQLGGDPTTTTVAGRTRPALRLRPRRHGEPSAGRVIDDLRHRNDRRHVGHHERHAGRHRVHGRGLRCARYVPRPA